MSGFAFKLFPVLENYVRDGGVPNLVERNIEIIKSCRFDSGLIPLFLALEKFVRMERTQALSDEYAAIKGKDVEAAQLLQLIFLVVERNTLAADDLELIEAIEGFEDWHWAMQIRNPPHLKLVV